MICLLTFVTGQPIFANQNSDSYKSILAFID